MAGRADTTDDAYRQLASYRRCVEHIEMVWPEFVARRGRRLGQGLFDAPVEKVAENILEDLFTLVLDWSLDDVNLQVGRADIVLSDNGIKRLVLEVKRPGTLIWHRQAIVSALDQARRYADEQRVGAVAVSDGNLLYAADVIHGGLRDRVLVALDRNEPPEELWWLSVHGIYRSCPALGEQAREMLDEPTPSAQLADVYSAILHPKYRLPVDCFAYVGSAADARTWKLPYLQIDASPDTKRLPKAIQAILSNYRGAKVTIPRQAVGDVLVRLALAAAKLRKLPCQSEPAADAYVEVHAALLQLGRIAEVGCCT